MRLRARTLILPAVVAAAAFTGCAVDPEVLAEDIEDELEDARGIEYDVACPDEISDDEGDQFQCNAFAEDGSDSFPIFVIAEGDGEFRWQVGGPFGGDDGTDDGTDDDSGDDDLEGDDEDDFEGEDGD